MVTRLLLLLLAAAPAWSGQLLVLDPSALNPELARPGTGLDGRRIAPAAVARACRAVAVTGVAVYRADVDVCRPLAAVPGLRRVLETLTVRDTDAVPVLDHVAAGALVAVAPRRRTACVPGACPRRLLAEGALPVVVATGPPPPPPPAPAISVMEVTPQSLTAGETATVSWAATGVATCLLGDSGTATTRTVDATGEETFTPEVDTAWTLTCSGAGGSTFRQAVAAVNAPPEAPEIVFFAPTLAEVSAGEKTTLRWETRFADGCALDDGGGFVEVPVAAKFPVVVPETTTYVLRCSGAGGEDARKASIRATEAETPPEIAFFRASPGSILRGASVFMSWEASDTEGCVLADPVQRLSWRVRPAGSFKLAPTDTTTYALSCRNASGAARAERTVTVTESDRTIRMTSFRVSRFSFGAGKAEEAAIPRLREPGLVQVDWSTADAATCQVASDGQDAASLRVPVNGTYVLWVDESTALGATCASTEGEAQGFDRVEVLGEVVFFGDFEG